MPETPASSPSGTPPPVALATQPKTGDLIGGYRVESVIQQGGMGEVFLVTAVDGGDAPLVLKRLPLHADDDEDGYASMFRAETEVMSRLRHPNIVSVLDSFETEGEMCLALEFIRGRNLLQLQRACAEKQISIAPGVGVYIMVQVLEGLHYAHTFVLEDGRPLGLVHRDVTPGNVLVSFNGEVKVTDFGIAKSVMSQVSTRVGVVKGTTRYLSPEQIRARPVTPRSDVFSASVVLTELLTGEPLFDRGNVAPTLFAIVNGERPEVAKLLPFAAPELSGVLEEALATDPDARPATALTLADRLRWAAQAQGWTEGAPELAQLIQQLFPEAEKAPVQSTVRASAPRLDLTYLLEVSDPGPYRPGDEGPAPVEEELRALLQGMISGAAPLDASQFDSGPRKPNPPPLPAMDTGDLEPPTVPPENEDGDSRMLAMTVPVTSFEEPTAGVAVTDEGAAPPETSDPPTTDGVPTGVPPPRSASGTAVPANANETPAEVRTRDILDALDHVSSEIDALDKTPAGASADRLTVPGASARRPSRSWLRDIAMVAVGVLLGFGGGQAALLAGWMPPGWSGATSSSPTTLLTPGADRPPSPDESNAKPKPKLAKKPTQAIASAPPAGPDKGGVGVGAGVVAPGAINAGSKTELAVSATKLSAEPKASKSDAAAPTKPPAKATKAKSKKAPAKTPVGYLTVSRPRGARVYVDGTRLRKKVPFKRVRVRKGRRVVKIVKRRYLRVFEINMQPGLHLDVTGGRTKVMSSKSK